MLILESFANAPKIAKLTGDGDYQMWAQEAEAAFQPKGIWGYIDGSKPEALATDKEKCAGYAMKHRAVLGLLTQMPECNIQHLLKGIVNAKTAWERLQKEFQASDLVQQVNLIKKALAMCFHPSISIDSTIIDLNKAINMMFDMVT